MPDNRKTSLGIQLTDGSICELIPPAPDATYRGGVTLEEKTKYDNYEGEINEIKEDLIAKEYNVSRWVDYVNKNSSYTIKKYVSKDGDIIDFYNYDYTIIDVSGINGKKIKIQTFINDDAGICFKDKQGNVIIGYNSTYKTPRLFLLDVSIPHEADKLYISCVREKRPISFELLDYECVDTINWTDGYYAYTNGEKISHNRYSYVKTNVEKMKSLILNVNAYMGNDAGYYFSDENDNFISSGKISTESLKSFNVVVPHNAMYLYLSCERTWKNRCSIYFDVRNNISSIQNDIEELQKIETLPIANIKSDVGLLKTFLNVGCIGDSLASGESVGFENGSVRYVDNYNYSWGQYLARMTGNKYYNWSKGGLDSKTWYESEYATECYDGEHLCEAYIIGLGQNDYNNHTTLGTIDDINLTDYSQNPNSYYGNYGKIIQRIKAIQPRAKIFVITDYLKTTETAGYNQAVRDISELFSNVYLLDLYNSKLDEKVKTYIDSQNYRGHYTAIGYYYHALVIGNYIDWIVKNNMSSFRDIQFIGTDYQMN